MEWKLQQSIGEKNPAELLQGDVISAVEFNEDGLFLAVGDRGGRVRLYERTATSVASPSMAKSPTISGLRRGVSSPTNAALSKSSGSQYEYKLYHEFKSHESEFDYLKSLEIEEKINMIRWLPRTSLAHTMLTTNDKTIKLWKISPKAIPSPSRNSPLSNLFPASKPDSGSRAHPRCVYANGHAYHINSLSVSADGETFISADDLRVNLWNLQVSNTSFNVVDIKPTNMEDLTEVITAAACHPKHSHQFVWSNSRGAIRLSDMRSAALCDEHSKVFEEPDDPARRSFFSEIISSVSDVKFSHDGRYILSRDYMTLRLWDVNMEARPVKTIHVHETLRPRLCDLYESDCIFDKFQCCFSGDGANFVTGSYQNLFHIYDSSTKQDTVIEASKNPAAKKKATPKSKISIVVQGAGAPMLARRRSLTSITSACRWRGIRRSP